MKFDCWMGEQCQLIVKMQKLKGIDIRNQEEVMAGIDILEALDMNLYEFFMERNTH